MDTVNPNIDDELRARIICALEGSEGLLPAELRLLQSKSPYPQAVIDRELDAMAGAGLVEFDGPRVRVVGWRPLEWAKALLRAGAQPGASGSLTGPGAARGTGEPDLDAPISRREVLAMAKGWEAALDAVKKAQDATPYVRPEEVHGVRTRVEELGTRLDAYKKKLEGFKPLPPPELSRFVQDLDKMRGEWELLAKAQLKQDKFMVEVARMAADAICIWVPTSSPIAFLQSEEWAKTTPGAEVKVQCYYRAGDRDGAGVRCLGKPFIMAPVFKGVGSEWVYEGLAPWCFKHRGEFVLFVDSDSDVYELAKKGPHPLSKGKDLVVYGSRAEGMMNLVRQGHWGNAKIKIVADDEAEGTLDAV